MVNASLNWASIVGIVLAVCGAGLYFLRSFKPALARDYDVFFAAIGLLCGGILFFQGWRLDPILQFGQFLLAGTTVFFAYESVRLRGVATDQARRSSYFDEDPGLSRSPLGGSNDRWSDDGYDQFEEAQPISRRFAGRDFSPDEEESFPSRRPSRAAIPEEAVSRRSRNRPRSDSYQPDIDSDSQRRMERFRPTNTLSENKSRFGDRRVDRTEVRRGNRPLPNDQNLSKRPERGGESTSRRREREISNQGSPSSSRRREREISNEERPSSSRSTKRPSLRTESKYEDAAFSSSRANSKQKKPLKNSQPLNERSNQRFQGQYKQSSPNRKNPRDNSSRFDD